MVRAFQSDTPAVALNHLAADGKSQAGALGFVRGQRLEKAGAKLVRHAGAAVSDANEIEVRVGLGLDHDGPAPLHRLDRIYQQIFQHPRKLIRVR